MSQYSDDKISKKLELLEDILESIPTGIIVLDSEGKIEKINRWQEKISKVKRDEVIGRYFHDKWQRLFEQGFMDGYWDLLKDGTPFESTVHEVYPQFYDQKITAISRGVKIPSDQGFVLLHDVSEEMKRDKRGIADLQDQLSEANNFLRNLIDSSPNIVITTGSDGTIRSLNHTGQLVFGYEEEKLLGDHISKLIENEKEFQTLLQYPQNESGVEFNCIKRDGQLFPGRIQTRDVVTKTGKFQAKLILINDLTWEKRMEEKLAITQKLAIYSELMAGIAHQLNNPLVGVVSFAALLLEKTDSDDSNKEMVKTIFEAAQKCQLMVSSLMKSIHQPESVFQSVNLNDILVNAIDVSKDEVAELSSKLEIKIQLELDIPTIHAESFQLLEAFRNIIVNAMQAMPNGGCLNVQSSKKEAAGIILITISDTGEGISQSNLARIFDPFFSTKTSKGYGLGLSFAFQVMKSHSARIQVESELNKGSAFTMEFPYEEDNH